MLHPVSSAFVHNINAVLTPHGAVVGIAKGCIAKSSSFPVRRGSVSLSIVFS
jgi:hypothetical protein